MLRARIVARRLGARGLANWGKGTPVQMPALSPTMTAGKIAKWSKKPGDEIKSGDVLAEVETDKATVDFQFQEDAFLAKILVPEGAEDVKVGTPLALVVEDKADIAEVAAGDYSAALSAAAGGAAAPAPAAAAAAAAPAPAAAAAASHSSASSAAAVGALPSTAVFPAARLLMANNHVDPAPLVARGGSGKGGRITKADVLVHLGKIDAAAVGAPAKAAAAPAPAAAKPVAAAAPAAAAPKPAAPAAPVSFAVPERAGGTHTDTKPSTVRRVIAARLTESKAGIPHQYAIMDCRIDALMKLRSTLKDAGVTVSVNDMVIKAAAKALRDVPEVNCFYEPKSDSVKPNSSVDISVAVATDGGLITPIVKGADGLGLVGISDKVKDLAGRARTGKLKPEEFQGGSFTISNLGMFGIDDFTAVINPPQAAILAVGKGEKKVVLPPISSPDDIDPTKPMPEPAVATVMAVQLSSDARVVDPAIAGQFLQAFRHYIQNPALLVA